MNQVEFLLRLSENARETGDDIARRHHDERAAHIKTLNELWRMIELARQNVYAEVVRFGGGNEAPKEDPAAGNRAIGPRPVRTIAQEKETAQR